MNDPAAAYSRLVPRAIAWAEVRSADILATGRPLNDFGRRLAKSVGVTRADLIRVSLARQIPLPDDPELRAFAIEKRLLGPKTFGLTLGYGIYIIDGHASDRLISHECRHVFQYEAAGSIATFVPLYLEQIDQCGYEQAPYEIDARLHERDAP